MSEKIKLKTWFQLPHSENQKRFGFGANQIFSPTQEQEWYMSYQPTTPDTNTAETALMPEEIILRGDHRKKLSAIYKKSGKNGCKEYFKNSKDKITEGFMDISMLGYLR